MYTSVVFDWQRAISEIGFDAIPPTPSVALSTATTVVESSSGLADRLTRHPPVASSGSGFGSGAAGSVSTVSDGGSAGAGAPHPVAKMSPTATATMLVAIPERIGLPPSAATA